MLTGDEDFLIPNTYPICIHTRNGILLPFYYSGLDYVKNLCGYVSMWFNY